MSYPTRKPLAACLVATDDVAQFHSLAHALPTSNNLNLWQGRGKVLFTDGERAIGIYILRTGRATVSISSSGGKTIILRVAQSGDVLGLNATLRDGNYDATVQTLEPSRIDFVSRAELLEFMGQSQQGTQAVLRELSHELTELADCARSLLLSPTSSVKLAKLLLAWGARSTSNGSPIVRIEKTFTQEEIGQMIGASRETVTRLLTTLSRRRIIEVTADSILIRDWSALETAAEDK